MGALVWRSYCRCADTTDRLLQMLTMFDQHDQCPCKEGRESSEKPTKDIWAWVRAGTYTVLEASSLDRGLVPFSIQAHSMRVSSVTIQIKFLSQEHYAPVTTPAGAKYP